METNYKKVITAIVMTAAVVAGYFVFQSASRPSREIKLYYYSQELDKDENGNILCSRKGLVPVERKIPTTQTPIQDTVKLLLSSGLADLEGVSLKGASLKDGFLTLEFEDPKNKTVGGACRVGILWFQIEATAKQFPEVQQVRFLPEELFQP
ncbi:MAG: GerMN domain-containing protein [Candidatus Nealsonbacteria bacterium]|nr:GerMN domain-containing protein [Candidatus Nealsonbacteria bacterium]